MTVETVVESQLSCEQINDVLTMSVSASVLPQLCVRPYYKRLESMENSVMKRSKVVNELEICKADRVICICCR